MVQYYGAKGGVQVGQGASLILLADLLVWKNPRSHIRIFRPKSSHSNFAARIDTGRVTIRDSLSDRFQDYFPGFPLMPMVVKYPSRPGLQQKPSVPFFPNFAESIFLPN